MAVVSILTIHVQSIVPHRRFGVRLLVGMTVVVLILCFNIFSAYAQKPVRPTRRQPATTTRPVEPAPSQLPDSIPLSEPVRLPAEVVEDEFTLTASDSLLFTPVDSIAVVNDPSMALFTSGTVVDSTVVKGNKVFVPDPTRAVWLSALCPGLGQIYNRRYWKLPIVVGGFMGLGYGASWNNNMLRDYTRAYNDIMDNDPSTNSYMDFFPPNTVEESLNKTWLQRVLKSRKDYYRRNRDLCVISMIGVYLIAVVDAYVDASLSNFDITPDLSMQVAPALLRDVTSPFPALGVQWAFNF
mgnify:CR=1 FL=1